jgi:hypothetical protein
MKMKQQVDAKYCMINLRSKMVMFVGESQIGVTTARYAESKPDMMRRLVNRTVVFMLLLAK